MEKTEKPAGAPYLIPFDVPLLREVRRMDEDYFHGKFNHLMTSNYDTDKAIKLGQAMYETSIEASKIDYSNLLVIFGVFAQICHNRYGFDVTFNDFWRLQKIVHEQSERYRKEHNGKKGSVGVQ